MSNEKPKIKDSHIACSSSQATMFYSFSTYCSAEAKGWTADVAVPQGKTSVNFTAVCWNDSLTWIKKCSVVWLLHAEHVVAFQRLIYFQIWLSYGLIARLVPHAGWILLIPPQLSFRLLFLTYRALLHWVQFASHGQRANYIAWTDPFAFEPDVGALISLLFLSPLSLSCFSHTFCWQPQCCKVAHCSSAA